MKYYKKIVLKNGRELILRNGTAEDGKALLDNFNQCHAETDNLLTYPDENSFTAEAEAEFLDNKEKSEKEIEILAFVDGVIAGCAGFEAVGSKFKLQHRCDYGISILKEFWGMGIGSYLTEACIECSKAAGYEIMELTAVAENESGLNLYRKFGFEEFGRFPKGFKSRFSGYQTVVYMYLDLKKK